MEQFSEGYVASLLEAIEYLQEDLSRHRRSNKLLRIINSSLRQRLDIAHQNDEEFKKFCNSDIVVIDIESNVAENGMDYPVQT